MTQVTQAPEKTRAQIATKTLRVDPWWRQPAINATFLAIVVIYLTWASLVNTDYFWAPYISPLYSPCLATTCAAGSGFHWIPWLSALTPAIIIIGGPMGFRLTCYYYRKAYYRSFWLTPPACAVPDLKRGYSGETKFPLILQAFHRYTWYVAVLFIVMLTWDAILAFRFPNGFGIGVGTLVMWINVIFLAGYTFSCHSCRHVCGGHVNVFSKAPTRYRVWHFVTSLNERHPMFAWLSLFSVGLTDLYIRLVSMGILRDWRII